MTYLIFAGYLALINLFAFMLFRADKRRAEAGAWRVPETHLLMISFCGGWFGAKAAQYRLRHKTVKQPFRALLNGVPVTWALIVGLPMLTTFGASDEGVVARNAVHVSYSTGSEDFRKTATGWMKARTGEETPKFFRKAKE